MANYLQTLTPKARGIVTIIIVAVSAVALFFIVKEIRAYIRRNQDRKDPKVVVEESQTEYNQQAGSGETLSKPVSDYKASANTIVKLLDGCESYGSEINVIENIITVVKKPIDWSYLKIQFGVQEISDCGSFGVSKSTYDLPTLLKDQLDSSGIYSIDIEGYKATGFSFESINILRDYFKTIGITI